jgi:MoaA/NifB/PqqE/SkfB family radical SAM enzyme
VSLASLVARSWRDNHLFSVLVELTYRCNLNCYFCYNDLGQRGRELGTEQFVALFEELAEMGVLNLTLSGGEPLAHRDFFALGGHARRLGFVVRVKTNGHTVREPIARRLREEVDPFIVEVSLHGATAATHDRQTRVPGSFERLVANIRVMLDEGLRVKVNTTLTAWNEGELGGMFALVDGFGVAFQVDPEVTPRDDGDRAPLSIRASREGLERLYRLQMERALAARPGVLVAREGDAIAAPVPSGKHCGAGSSVVAVDPFGNVYPCVQWRRPVGNLHEHSMREIWAGSRELAAVRETTTAVADVVAGYGDAGPLLGFCPGAAQTASGDPLRVDDEHLLRADLAARAIAAARSPTRLPIVGQRQL